MEITLIAVGKIKEKGLREALTDYYGRIGHYCKFSEIEIKDGPEPKVSEALEKHLSKSQFHVALEVLGKPMTSQELSKEVGRWETHSIGSIALVIGGSYGLPQHISKKAHLQLSLSNMTLPHRLARLILAEQIYRAFSILRNEPYSH